MDVELLVERVLAGETRLLSENAAKMPFRPQQIPYDLIWVRTRASEVGSRYYFLQCAMFRL
jgi:hypothetical protein